MAHGELVERWQEQYEQITEGVAAWHKQHPRATFSEIEAELDKRLNQLRAEMLADMAGAGEARAEQRPLCPQCGRQATLRGKKRRRLRTQGGEEVVLERHHAICPHCGTAFFPPG